MAKPKWMFWRKETSQAPPLKTTDFGILTNGRESQLIDFAAPGSIAPEEASKLLSNAKVGNLRIDLDGAVDVRPGLRMKLRLTATTAPACLRPSLTR